jgi:hypothetical protein
MMMMMGNYLLAFHGGGIPKAEAEKARVMQAWTNWFGELGDAVVDPGNPVGQEKTVSSDGSVSAGGGANAVTGYTIIRAADLDDAVRLAAGCPIRASGGSIEVGETLAMV